MYVEVFGLVSICINFAQIVYNFKIRIDMNKLLLSLAALAVSAAASAQNVYSTDFEGADEFAKWTVVDANNDGVTWVYDA